MANDKRDENGVVAMLGASSVDGTTPVRVGGNPTNHALRTDDDTTGTDLTGDNAPRDANSVPVLLAVSSADGVTTVPVYADPATGKLLINSH